jgi:hypothetical protein
MPEPKPFYELLSNEKHTLEFWRSLALGLLRRAEEREAGFSFAVGRLLYDSLEAEEDIERIAARGGDCERAKKALDNAVNKLEAKLANLKIDRRKLKPDPWPIPRWDLVHEYDWLFFIIRTLKRVLRQDGFDEAARRVWGNFYFEAAVRYEEYVAAIGGNPLKFWEFALLLAFFKFGDVEKPDAPTLEAMARACMAEPPGTAALSVLELCCTIKDLKTGKLRTLSADKIKQYISRRRATFKVRESLRERFRIWEEEGFRYLATGEDPDVEKRLAEASNRFPAI